MDTIRSDSSVLVLVDYQARLMPSIHEGEDVTARAVLVAKAAHVLGIPVLGTEQNPAGLGPNVESIKAQCDRTLGKTHFNACADGLVEAVDEAKAGCSQVVIAGCEAHVCMLQTALGMLRAGKRVAVISNASGSRRPSDHSSAMQRLTQAGATIVTHEMVLFEWLDDCKHPGFKEVLTLIKAAK